MLVFCFESFGSRLYRATCPHCLHHTRVQSWDANLNKAKFERFYQFYFMTLKTVAQSRDLLILKLKEFFKYQKRFPKNFLYWPKCQKDAFYVLLLYGYNSVCVLIGCWVGIIFLLWPGIMKFFSSQRLSWVVSKVMSMWAKTTVKKDGQSKTTLSITERKTSIYILL